MTDFARLGIKVDSQPVSRARDELGRFVRAGRGAAAANDQFTASSQRSTGAAAGLSAALRKTVIQMGAVVGIAQAARAVGGASESYTKMTNSLRAMGIEAGQAAGVLQSIANVANRTRAPLDATAQLYSRISIAGRDLGASQAQVLRFTENVGLALAQTGTSSQEASGALLQLSQAMAGGTVRAEEFNSILEGAFPIAQAAANAIDGASGSVGRLRQMVVEGEVSSREFFEAILRQTDALEMAFEQTVPTISQAFGVLGNNFTMFIGEMDAATGASGAVAEAILLVADNMNAVAGLAIAAGVAVAGAYAPAIYGAVTATGAWVASLITLRGALLATGVGALVVGAGLLIGKLFELVKATGGWGAALNLLGEVASGVWQGIKESASAIPLALASVWELVKSDFMFLMAGLAGTWRDFLISIGQSGDAADAAVTGFLKASNDAAVEAGKLSASAKELAIGGFDAARKAAEKLQSTVEKVTQSASDGSGALSTLEDGAGKAGKGLKKTKSEAEAFAEAMEDAAYTAEDFGKAKAEILIRGIDNVSGAFGDFVARGFSDFKSFAKNILDTFKGMLADMIAMAARNQIMIGLGFGGVGAPAGGAAPLGGAAGGGAAGGGAGSLLSGLGAATGAFGSGVGLGFSSMVGGSFGATFAGQLGAAATGSMTAIAGAVGMVAAPILAVAAVVSFFKKKVTELDAGVRVTVDGMDALIENFSLIETKRFWGLSKNQSTNYTTVEDEAAAPIQASIDAIGESVIGFADTLGLASDNIANVAYQFQVSTKGLSDAEIQEALTREFDLLADEFAGAVMGSFTETSIAEDAAEILQAQIDAIPSRLSATDVDRWQQQYAGRLDALNRQLEAVQSGTVDASSAFVETIEHINPEFAKLQKEGEGAYDTLERLATSLGTFNGMADMLNLSMMETSVAGGAAAAHLVELMGGLDAFTATSTAYWGAFFTEAERLEQTTEALTGEFDRLGLSLPQSRMEFRALIESLDLTTQGGREAYAELMGLAGALDQVLPSLHDVSAAISGLVDVSTGQVGQMISTAQEAQRAAANTASEWYRASDTIRSLIRELSGVTVAQGQGLALNRARFNTAFDLVKSGDVDAAKDLPALARAYLDSAKAQASTGLEYRRMAAQVQSQLQFAAGVADLEGANDEVIVGLYEQQISVLTDLGTYLANGALTAEEIDAMSATIDGLAGAIEHAEAFSYDDLVGSLDVLVSLADDAPRWVQRLVDSADSGLRTTLDFIIRRDDLTPADRWIATNSVSEHISSLDFVLRNDLDGRTRRIVLTGTEDLTRNLDLILRSDLDPNTRRLALTRQSNLEQQVNFILGQDLSAANRRLALTRNAEIERSLSLVLERDLDPNTRALAIRSVGTLTRTLDLALGEDLSGAYRRELFDRAATLTRRFDLSIGRGSVRTFDRLKNLLGGGRNEIRLSGGVSFDPDGVFSGLTDATEGLTQPMGALTSALGQLRDAVAADRVSREIASIQAEGAAARLTVAGSREEARDVRDQLRDLFEANGIVSRGGDFHIGADGALVAGADKWATSGNFDGIMADLAANFGVRGRTLRERVNAVLAQVNDPLAQNRDDLQALRRAYRDLTGNAPAFANGGTHRGGLARVGESDLELVAPSRIYSPSETKAMLDNREMVEELRALRKELADLKSHTERADFEKIRTSKDQLFLAQKADTRGIKVAE